MRFAYLALAVTTMLCRSIRNLRVTKFKKSYSLLKCDPQFHEISGYMCLEKSIEIHGQNGKHINVVVLEATARAQDELVKIAIDSEDVNKDPYGCVLWPAATTVSERLLGLDLSELTVLELGCGTGLVSLVAAIHGARRVICTDYNPFSLSMVEKAKKLQTGIELKNIETLLFDVKDLQTPLPPANIVVIADLLYDSSLGKAVAHRIHECVIRKSKVIIADSPGRPGRPDMLATLKLLLNNNAVDFSETIGKTVTGARNSIISLSSTDTPQLLPMGLLEL